MTPEFHTFTPSTIPSVHIEIPLEGAVKVRAYAESRADLHRLIVDLNERPAEVRALLESGLDLEIRAEMPHIGIEENLS